MSKIIKWFPKLFEQMRKNVDKTFKWTAIIKRLVASITRFLQR